MVVFITELKGWSAVLFYGGIFLFGLLFYYLARKSRKVYKCPECGESFKVELMDATRCKVCGTEVDLSNESDISDKI